MTIAKRIKSSIIRRLFLQALLLPDGKDGDVSHGLTTCDNNYPGPRIGGALLYLSKQDQGVMCWP